MSTIIWQKPDGGVAVTRLSPEALEQMAWARENVALLDQKIELVASAAALDVAIDAASEQLAGIAVDRRLLMRMAASELGVDDKELEALALEERARAAMPKAVLALVEEAEGKDELAVELDERLKALQQERRDLTATLETIARLEHVRDSIGFDEHGHELVLKRRAQEHVAEMAAKGVTVRPDIIDYVCVGHAREVGGDRTFRDAWVWRDGRIDCDLGRARLIHKDRIRAVRRPILEALDGKELAAQRRQDATALATVQAQKQALCDAPAHPSIEKAASVEELKAAWPDALMDHSADLVERAFNGAGLSAVLEQLSTSAAAAQAASASTA